MVEITAVEQTKEKRIKRMRTVQETSGITLNAPTFTFLSSPRRREKGPKKIFEEIIAENFPNMGKETLKSRKCRVPYRINPKRNTPIHVVIKLTKIKDKELICGI